GALPDSRDIVTGDQSWMPGVDLDGTKGAFAYSGGGYQIAQLFAEDISGRAFAPLMNDLVLTPIGMSRSSFAQPIEPDAVRPLKIAGANSAIRPLEGLFWPLNDSWRDYPMQAAAGLWTTVGDYARFADALVGAANGRAGLGLNPDVAHEMLRIVDAGYGLGVFVKEASATDEFSVYHGGANAGYRCAFRVFPDREAMIVVMTNAPDGDRLRWEVFDGLEQALMAAG
ncbi:MAG: serine hydrolase domain-containing protein, partial [Pseudomonadota bacterium]